MLNMKLSDLDKPVSEENGGSPPRAALVWMTEHQRDCSVGAHEAEGEAMAEGVVVTQELNSRDDRPFVSTRRLFLLCRHCRCLYVEKP